MLCGSLSLAQEPPKPAGSEGLVGYWKLQGDCKDHSGKGNHGINHGVDLKTGEFNGRSAYVEVPNSPSLGFGVGDFSISAWVATQNDLEDVRGEIASKYDPARRKGFHLGLDASAAAYNAQGDDRHIHFGIDNAKQSEWLDCGRPLAGCNYFSGLTVFNGDLYAANTDAPCEEDWSHVFRYRKPGAWEDCGRVGDRRTMGIHSMIVHNGSLYVATHNVGLSTRGDPNLDKCRVYRYGGDRQWEDCGLGECRRMWGFASYKGKLYILGDDPPSPRPGDKPSPWILRCYVYAGGKEWRVCRDFPAYACAAAVYDGKLHVAVNGVGVETYDGRQWQSIGGPLPRQHWSQLHCLKVYRGELYAGTWPEGRVAAYRRGQWDDCGPLGDCNEVVCSAVYNGKLYFGTLPHAEVFRYDGDGKWTSMKRFFEADPAAVKQSRWPLWGRGTSLTVYDGKLFYTVGSGAGNLKLPGGKTVPCDVRGKVFRLEAGQNISFDRDLGPGWKHIAAVKEQGRLKLYVDGELVKSSSSPFDFKQYDLSNDEPLYIGFGGTDCFCGKIREVRLYNRAISDREARDLHQKAKPVMSEK
jgi:hypothetical protein